MHPILRSALAVVAGVITMWVVVSAVEWLSHLLISPPAGMDPNDPDQFAHYLANAPASAMLMLVLAWLLGAAAGGWIAARIATRRPWLAAGIVGAVVVIGVIGMIMTFPQHPKWVSTLGVLLPIPAALLAARHAHRRVVL